MKTLRLRGLLFMLASISTTNSSACSVHSSSARAGAPGALVTAVPQEAFQEAFERRAVEPSSLRGISVLNASLWKMWSHKNRNTYIPKTPRLNGNRCEETPQMMHRVREVSQGHAALGAEIVCTFFDCGLWHALHVLRAQAAHGNYLSWAW